MRFSITTFPLSVAVSLLVGVAGPLLGQDKPETRPALPPVELPKAAATQAPANAGDSVTVTIFHVDQKTIACAQHASTSACSDILHWRFRLDDRDYTATATQNQAFTEALQKHSGWKPGEKLCDKRVTLRTDRRAPYSLVQTAMTAFATAGLAQVEFGAIPLVGDKPGVIPNPLPTDAGDGVAPLEVRISIKRDAKSQEIRRSVAGDVIPPGEGSDAALKKAIQAPRDAAKSRPLAVTLESAADVPWTEVIRVLDVTRSLGIDKVEFAVAPVAPPIPESRRPK